MVKDEFKIKLLKLLKEKTELTSSVIRKECDCSKNTLTSAINELRADGYNITRQRKASRDEYTWFLSIGTVDIEQQKEKIIDTIQKRKEKQYIQQLAQTELVIEACEASIAKMNLILEPMEEIIYTPTGQEECMVALLSDIHAGKKTKSYSMDVAKERLSIYFNKIIKIAKIHRNAYPVEELYLVILGDIVDGESIYPGQPFEIEYGVLDQCFILVAEIIKHIYELNTHFKKIHVVAVPGNHGRNMKFSDKKTNFDLVTYYTMKQVLKDNPNITFQIPENKDVWTQFEVLGHKFLATHGHKIKMWMNIPWYGIIQKGMRWKGSMKQDWDVLLLAHFHNFANFDWNDFECIVNGSFVTDDDYAVEDLGLRSPSRQVVFGVHPKYGVTWRYKINVVE